MLSLYIVHSVTALSCCVLVSIVEAVPVDLSVSLRCAPVVVRCLPVFVSLLCAIRVVVAVPYVVVARRQVLPVVRMRVVGVVVVELCALVHRVFAEERRSEFRVLVEVPVPCEDGARSEVVHDARVALLAVLVAPVGVVVAVVGEPVDLVRCSTLCRALRRVAPCREREAVVAHHLLHGEEVRERVVECALYVSVACPAVAHVAGERPSLLRESAAVRVHAAQGIVAVGAAYCQAVAYGHCRRTEVVVVRSAHA